MISGSYLSGIWLLLMGWFLNSTTRSYLAQHQLRSILSGIHLSSIMNRHIIAVRKDMLIDGLIQEYFNTSSGDFFAVSDDFGHLVGMVKAKDAFRVPEYRRALVYVLDIMIQKSDLIIMNTETSVDDVLKHMSRKRNGRVAFICDQDGKLTGLISKRDIRNAASERTHRVNSEHVTCRGY